MIKSTVSGVNDVMKELKKMAERLDAPMITVGIHEDSADPTDGQITMASLGAVHEFGADIKHPGGTNYGYKSKSAALKGQVRFMRPGDGYMVLGQTRPHNIKIPPRPWLEPGFSSGISEYTSIMEDGIISAAKGKSIMVTLNKVGVIAVGKIQKFMTELKSPGNAASTVRKKGSANPLIDSGAMRSAVTFKIQQQKPEEGL